MITNIFLLTIQGFAWTITQLLGLIPVMTFPAEFTDSLAQVSQYAGAVDNFLPITSIFLILGLMLVLEAGIISYKIIQWVIKKIPGIS